jgi:HEPN domain-containing protein
LANPTMTRAWFKKANKDLKLFKFIYANDDDEVLEGCAFHCQQCIEKSIKGFLAYKGVRFDKIHDLKTLAKKACDIEPSLDFLKDDPTFLDTVSTYAAGYRYPDAAANLPPLTREVVKKAMVLAENCFRQLSAMIGT